ncbi:DRTGG domain-containing protein, partial [Ornithobacterium rhinotracheale]
IGIVANKIQEENVEALKQHLDKYLPENVEKIIVPLVSELQNPRIKEIVEEVDADVVDGKEPLSNLTGKCAVGAMQLPKFLNHIDQNSMVITPGDLD